MEKLLVFHLNETELKKLKKAAGNLKIRYDIIEPDCYKQTLEALSTDAKAIPQEPYTGEVPGESLLVMCNLTESRMDKLLLSLRKYQANIDYKAILTPTNRKWNVLRLMLEMRAEKAAFQNDTNK